MKTSREFLTALWGNPPPGVILIWTLPKKESNWYTRLDQVNQDVEHHAHEDVYTGVGIANQNRARFTTQNRCTEEEVSGLAGMWADIDVAHPVHRKPNLPPTQEQALATLEEALLEPTLLVDSGHGIQAWWLFEQPWIFQTPEDQELGRRAAQWWHQHIKGLYTARGWTTDSVFNLDRIMRLPGTWNNRVPGERRPVEIIRETARRYTPQDFLDLTPEDFQTSTPPPGRTGPRKQGQNRRATNGNGGTGGNGGLELDPEADPPLLKLDALRKANLKFRGSWEQDRKDMADQSPSAYDLSMATMAMQAGWSDQEVVNLLICWRRKHDHDLKLRENYYVVTLEKAKEPFEIAQAEEQLNQTLLHPPDDETEVLMDNLAKLFGVDITRIVKYLGDPPIYYMYTEQGNITLGKIENIMSQERFRALAAAATEVVIPSVGKKIWEQRVQAMLLACEQTPVGDASHPAQETNAWLEEYLLEKPPREGDEWEKAAEAKRPFILHGKVHIFLDDFRRWLDFHIGEQVTSHALGRRLKQCQARTQRINVRVGNSRTSRTTWQLPERIRAEPVPEPPAP